MLPSTSTTFLAAALLLLLPASAGAAIKTKELTYKQGGTELQGFVAWDDAAKGKRPGILVVHEWWGHNAHARAQATRLAKAGYVALALDMYGKGKVTQHPDDAQKFMQEALKDPAVMKARFDAALALLKKQPEVDAAKIGAVGYCFGGGVVLGMARAGEDLGAVVSIHGSLATKSPAQPGKVKARILVIQGEADPMVPAAQVEALKKEMTAAHAKFEVVTFPGVKHGFTNPDADKAGVPGLAYDADADKKSFDMMVKLFRETFGK